MERALFILFLPLRVISSVKSPYKKKNYSPESKTCAWQTSFSAVFLLNKIMAPIFQIIHIQNKKIDPCVNRGLEERC